MNKPFAAIDLSMIQTVIYHMPDGQAVTLRIHTVEQLLDLDLENGKLCDTSNIDGVVHFFPHGNA